MIEDKIQEKKFILLLWFRVQVETIFFAYVISEHK